MPKLVQAENLKRFTETVLTRPATSPWPWALLKYYFPADSDEESKEKLDSWAREHHVDVQWGNESPARKGPAFRVVVLEPRRRRPLKRRPSGS
jgi:hypothetical protein